MKFRKEKTVYFFSQIGQNYHSTIAGHLNKQNTVIFCVKLNVVKDKFICFLHDNGSNLVGDSQWCSGSHYWQLQDELVFNQKMGNEDIARENANLWLLSSSYHEPE